MGKSDEATALIDGMDKMLADTAAAHPEFAGKTLSVINSTPPTVRSTSTSPPTRAYRSSPNSVS